MVKEVCKGKGKGNNVVVVSRYVWTVKPEIRSKGKAMHLRDYCLKLLSN